MNLQFPLITCAEYKFSPINTPSNSHSILTPLLPTSLIPILPLRFPHNYPPMIEGLSQNQLRYFFKKHELQLIKKIGSGSFGTVFLANCVQNDYLPFAVKIISKKQFAKHPSLQKYLTSEVNNMEVVKNSHVVKLFKKFEQANYFFLVMEYCQLGNLYTYQFTQPDKIFKLQDALRIFVQIIKGVNYIHKANVIHRDIKCQNILLKKKKNQTFTCKIGDFGFSKSVEQATKSHCGTPNFMAPEILAGKAYDKQVDIWSLGVILFYMLFADYPFKGMNLLYDIQVKCSNKYNLAEELASTPSVKRNKSIDQQQMRKLVSLFQQIFIINPEQRIQLKGIFTHELLGPFKDLINKEQQNTTESSDVEEISNFVFGKIEFVQQVIREVLELKLVIDPVLARLIQLYAARVQAAMLRVLYKEAGKGESSKKISLKKQISSKHEKLGQGIKKLIKQLSETNLKQYKLKEKAFQFSSTEYFQTFKDDYRVVVGLVFAEVHSSKDIKSLQVKEKLKLKILCCHTINRVFENGIGEDYWSCFKEWLKAGSKNQKEKTDNELSFPLLGKWLDEESRENIVKTISLINSKYYNSSSNQKGKK